MEMLGHDMKVRELVFGGWQAVCECGWMGVPEENIYFGDCAGQEHVQELKAARASYRVRIVCDVWEYGWFIEDDEPGFEYFDTLSEALAFVREESEVPDSAASLQDSSVETRGLVTTVMTFDGETRTETVYTVEENRSVIEQIEALLQPIGF